MRDPYTVLGVAKTASESEIKSAYRKLAKRWHPDTNRDDPKAQERFGEVSRAYDIVGDKDKRAQFDRGEIDADGNQTFPGGGAYPGGNPFTGADGFDPRFRGRRAGGADAFSGGAEDILNSFFGSAFAGARGQAGRGGGPDFDSMFGEPQPGRTRRAEPPKGADIKTVLNVTPADILSGEKARLKLPDGRTIAVALPTPFEDGKVMRLRGQGQAGPTGHRGDVLVTLKLACSPGMSARGADLETTVHVPLATAVRGGKITIDTPEGGRVALTIKPWTDSGHRLRLKGKGLPDSGGGRGDLYAITAISIGDAPREGLDGLFGEPAES